MGNGYTIGLVVCVVLSIGVGIAEKKVGGLWKELKFNTDGIAKSRFLMLVPFLGIFVFGILLATEGYDNAPEGEERGSCPG